MKVKVLLTILGIVLAMLLLAPGPALAGNASAESDIELAKDIAQVEVA